MVKALRSCLEAAKGKIKAGHLILRKSPKRTATGSSTASNISRIPIRHIYSLLVPGILESRMSQETASYWQSPSSRENPQKKPQENSYRIFYSLKYIPYTHSTCRIYSLLVPGILESRMSQQTASYWPGDCQCPREQLQDLQPQIYPVYPFDMLTWSCKVLTKSLFEGEIVPKIPPVLSKAPEQGLDYLRCDRKLQRQTQTNVLQPKRCHQLAFPGCCPNFLEAHLLSESPSPQPPIPVTGWTPFLDHGFLGPFDSGPSKAFRHRCRSE